MCRHIFTPRKPRYEVHGSIRAILPLPPTAISADMVKNILTKFCDRDLRCERSGHRYSAELGRESAGRG
jgi:hypothetical protein